LQGAWRISDRLVLRGFAEYMYSSFGDYFTSYCCTPDGTAAPTAPLQVEGPDGTTITVNAIAPVNFGGNSLRNQPQYKFSSSLAYEVPVASSLGSLNVVTIMSWRDQMYVDEANLDIYSVPAYTRWDLRANWRSPTGHYTVTGWVTNMLDEIAVQSYSPREGNGVTAPINGTVTDGRRIGVTVNYQL
jgi:outer membrane receptor protein involved in Fe transport